MSVSKIENGPLRAEILTWGASLRAVYLDGVDHSLVVGLDNPEDYVRDQNFLGASVGRFANRIRDGRIDVDSTTLILEKNDQGLHHLHGGETGFARRHWMIEDHGKSHVTLSLESSDGDANYPGNLKVHATYSILDKGTLAISYTASCDKLTPYNLCHHPYFCFLGPNELGPHFLKLDAKEILLSDDTLIPLGAPQSVEGSKFDFRSLAPIGCKGTQRAGYNNTYCLSRSRTRPLTHVANLVGGGIAMQLWTTQPGLHVYDAYKINAQFPALEERMLEPHRSICLEAQAWPNSPNQSDYPDAFLRPGETLKQVTEYRFARLEESTDQIGDIDP